MYKRQVYATPAKQWLYELDVPRGTLAGELLDLSGIKREISMEHLMIDGSLRLGVYSQPVDQDYLLEDGDRVEIYRALTADPKEVRRQLASLGRTMGKKG